jgi:hypothetical protein
MNELQIKTNSFTPAQVNFNYEQVSTYLDTLLEKYDGLVFTEETVTECKKTVAELRKGQRSLDDFRKKTKKELTKSVSEFETQCKKLYKKFDEVIDPLVEQSDFFEEQRKNEKKQKVQRIIDELIKGQGLNEKFAAQLIIEGQYLNKTKTLKSIREELTATAESLGIQQDKEESDKELIKTKVELANTKYNVNLSEIPYVRLLEYENVEDIETKINLDAERESQVEPEPIKYAEPVEKIIQPTITPNESSEIFVEKYEVEGTEGQLDALEEFMTANGLEWKIIE